MNNSRMRIKSAIAFVAVCSGLLMGVAAEAAGKPNIILIMTDDQGYGQLGSKGTLGSKPLTSMPFIRRVSLFRTFI